MYKSSTTYDVLVLCTGGSVVHAVLASHPPFPALCLFPPILVRARLPSLGSRLVAELAILRKLYRLGSPLPRTVPTGTCTSWMSAPYAVSAVYSIHHEYLKDTEYGVLVRRILSCLFCSFSSCFAARQGSLSCRPCPLGSKHIIILLPWIECPLLRTCTSSRSFH